MRPGSQSAIVPDHLPTLEAALEYVRHGMPITLCTGKKPLGSGWTKTKIGRNWQNKTWTENEIHRAFTIRGRLNVGLVLGARSKIIDIEADSPEQERSIAELFDGCDASVTPTFESERGKHRLFAWDDRLLAIGKAVVHFRGAEIRLGANGKGAQSLLPPSLNLDGRPRKWLVSIQDCQAARLPNAVIDRILAELLGKQTIHKQLLEPARCAASAEVAESAVLTAAIEQAIAATLPDGHGQRNRRIFDFVRQLKAIPELANANVQSLKPYLVKWHKAALPSIRTKEFLDSWLEFATAWKNANHAAGQEPIARLFEQSLTLEPPPEANQYEEPTLRQLIGLSRELQRASGSAPFYLDCRTAGRLLGISHVQANKYLRVLALDNVLKLVTRGTRGRASEFRYLGKPD